MLALTRTQVRLRAAMMQMQTLEQGKTQDGGSASFAVRVSLAGECETTETDKDARGRQRSPDFDITVSERHEDEKSVHRTFRQSERCVSNTKK